MEYVNRFLNWKQTRPGLLISGIMELVLVYIFGSLAIDSGSLWHYLLAIIFLVGAGISLVKVFTHGKK